MRRCYYKLAIQMSVDKQNNSYNYLNICNRPLEVICLFLVTILIFYLRDPSLAKDASTYIKILSYETPYSGNFGFFYYNQIVHNFLGIRGESYLILTSIIILTIFTIAFYRAGITDLRIFFLLSSPAVILLSINGFRQGFALAFITLIFSCKSKWTGLIILLLAYSFHSSALFIVILGLLLLIFFYKYYLSDWSLFILLPVSCFIISHFSFPFLIQHNLLYEYSTMNWNAGHTFYERLILYIILFGFIVYRKYIFPDKIYTSDYFALSTLMIVLVLQDIPYAASRVAYFLETFLLISVLVRIPAYSNLNRTLYFAAAIIFALLIYTYPSIKLQMFDYN